MRSPAVGEAFASGRRFPEDGGSTELGALERGRAGDGERPSEAGLAGPPASRWSGASPGLAAAGHVGRRALARTLERGGCPRTWPSGPGWACAPEGGPRGRSLSRCGRGRTPGDAAREPEGGRPRPAGAPFPRLAVCRRGCGAHGSVGKPLQMAPHRKQARLLSVGRQRSVGDLTRFLTLGSLRASFGRWLGTQSQVPNTPCMESECQV